MSTNNSKPTTFSWAVRNWMSKHVHVTHPSNMLVDALKIMCDHRVRHIPVIDGDKLVGIISDRDLRNFLPGMSQSVDRSARYGHVLEMRVSEAMTRLPITIPVDSTVQEAAEIMCREKIGALPVLDQNQLVGIISAEDLLWVLVELPQVPKAT